MTLFKLFILRQSICHATPYNHPKRGEPICPAWYGGGESGWIYPPDIRLGGV